MRNGALAGAPLVTARPRGGHTLQDTQKNPTHKVVHEIPLREPASVKVEVLPDDRVRAGLWRDGALVAGFALNAADTRELRSALAIALAMIEADA